MEVSLGPNWGCSAKEKKKRDEVTMNRRKLLNDFHNFLLIFSRCLIKEGGKG
jgi:hypothetical protein